MKLTRLIENPYRIFSSLAALMFFNWLPDKIYIQLMFRSQVGTHLDLNAPKTFNEKLQWLKLYDRRPEYTIFVDKYRVREHIAKTIGNQYLIPLLGVWEDPEDIDFDSLPEQFVLKCNHNSGTGMCICKDKSKLDIAKVKAELKKGLRENYYLHGREWPYKDVPRRIIAEKYLKDSENTDGLTDYKIYCFNGRAKMVMIASDRFSEAQTRFDYFDKDYHWLDLEWGNPRSVEPPPKPALYEKMWEVAEILSAGFPQIRVDLYVCNGNIYFGELTFFDGSGMEKFKQEDWDRKLGDWIDLSLVDTTSFKGRN